LNPHFKGAVIILAICCLITIVLAIYTLMPKLRHSKMPVDVNNPGFNLLFFGDFTRLEYRDFEAAMEEMMNDTSRTYQAQVRELYTLGQFLATRKYRTLRLAYFSFIFGLMASAITLMIGLQFK
jgi:hypothetical protein